MKSLNKLHNLVFKSLYCKTYNLQSGMFYHRLLKSCKVPQTTFKSLSFFSSSNHSFKKKNFKTNKYSKIDKWKNLPDSEYLYGRLVCEIVMKMSRRSILKVLVNSKWELVEPDNDHINFILDDAQIRGIPIEYVPISRLNLISQQRPHQGVCVEVGQLPLQKISTDEIKETFKTFELIGKLPLWVLLYDITDPMNVGNIIRSCHFLGVDKIVLTSQCAPISSTASKASSGAAEITPLNSVTNCDDFIEQLKSFGWDIIGTDSDEQIMTDKIPPVQNLISINLIKPTVLIFGSEGFGISNSIKEKCTKLVTIQPGKNSDDHLFVDCLNVGSAAAVIVHHFLNSQKNK